MSEKVTVLAAGDAQIKCNSSPLEERNIDKR